MPRKSSNKEKKRLPPPSYRYGTRHGTRALNSRLLSSRLRVLQLPAGRVGQDSKSRGARKETFARASESLESQLLDCDLAVDVPVLLYKAPFRRWTQLLAV